MFQRDIKFPVSSVSLRLFRGLQRYPEGKMQRYPGTKWLLEGTLIAVTRNRMVPCSGNPGQICFTMGKYGQNGFSRVQSSGNPEQMVSRGEKCRSNPE